ncbi:MAG: phosphoglucosamine mutase, partial [Acidobacteriota bacterium]
IRGAFGSPPLDEATVRGLAAALARELHTRGPAPKAVLGGDTRDSTPVLCRWLAEELQAGDVATTYLGVVPTPAVAFATRASHATAGIVVSASHNPHPDNGIKLIDGQGFKWSPAAEAGLESRSWRGSDSPAAVSLKPDEGAIEGYLQHLTQSLEGSAPLSGLAVALDTGNGAASAFAEELFTALGARVHALHANPDGRNINAGCGSTHPQVVAAEARAAGCDLGFAFDGDADRAIFADETGEVRDGDAMLYLWAKDLKQRGQLPGNRLVATSMSNLGLEVALRQEGIEVVRCDVGDRVVVETMRQHSIELGGEQSGHLVSLPLGTTGDGLMSALQLAALRQRDGRPLSIMLQDFQRFPQLLRNLRVRHKPDLASLPRVVEASREVERQLGTEGRLVLRYSGTEPLVRIMIEGRDRAEIEALADDLAAVLEAELT